MKLQLLLDPEQGIQNFEHVKVSTNQVDLSSISDNECEVILATDVLDSFSHNAVKELIGALLGKLRVGGELSIGGTDGRLLSKHILNGLLSPNDASLIVGNLESLTFMQSIQDLLMQAGLRVASTHMNGIHYEIKAVRG